MALNQDVAFKISADVTGQQAVDKLADSLKRLGSQGEMSSKQMVQAMRMVPAQLTDIATQLAGGQSPFLIMMQQGGQLRDMFGSVTGALMGVGRTLSTILTPINMAAAAIGALGMAAYKGSAEFYDLTNKLTLTGNASGYSASQIEKMARTLSNTAGISAGTARDLTAGLASTGQFIGSNLDLAASAIARVQRLTGQASDEIVKDFAAMSSGVAAWAAQHNRAWNYLTAEEFKHIKRLEEMGDKEGALRANMKALDKAFEERREQLGYIDKLWKSITESASAAWQAMKDVGKPDQPEDKLSQLRKRLEANARRTDREDSFGPYGKREGADAERAKLVEQIRELQKAIDHADMVRMEKAKEAAKEREKQALIDSGEAAARLNASLNLQLERERGASEKRIEGIQEEGRNLDIEYAKRLITEENYNARKLGIAKRTLDERIKLVEKERQIEANRPGDKVSDKTSRDAKDMALVNQRNKLDAEKTAAQQDADKAHAAFLQKNLEDLEKFDLAQWAHIASIRAEADAVNMTAEEYKKKVEDMRIDKEVADKMIGKDADQKRRLLDQAEMFKKETAAALDYAYQKSRSFETGAQDVFKNYLDTATNTAAQTRTLFTNAFKGMEDAMVNFVKTGKLDFKSLADSIISDMIRIMIQRQIMAPMMGALGSVFGGGASSAAPAGVVIGGPAFANGGIMTAGGALPLHAYASGGIANSPQMALFGEGRMPEAYVPLPDGRSIPVTMQGGQGGANVVVNVVNNANGANATTKERQDSNGNRIIDVLIEQVKASIAGDISRGVGTVPAAMERTYGANRAAGAY